MTTKKVTPKKPAVKKTVPKDKATKKTVARTEGGRVVETEVLEPDEFSKKVMEGEFGQKFSKVSKEILDAVTKIIDANPGVVVSLVVGDDASHKVESCIISNQSSAGSIVNVCDGMIRLSQHTFEKLAHHV